MKTWAIWSDRQYLLHGTNRPQERVSTDWSVTLLRDFPETRKLYLLPSSVALEQHQQPGLDPQ